MDNRRLIKVLTDLYTTVYSELGADFEELKTREEDWFQEFEMTQERQEELLEEVCKKYKLNKRDKNIISINYWLGCSPRNKK